MEQSVMLKAGVVVNGETVREFTIRPLLVRDSVEAYDDPKAKTNTIYFGALLMGRRLTPALSTEQVLGMQDSDYRLLMEADEALLQRLSAGFSGKGDTPAVDSGPA